MSAGDIYTYASGDLLVDRNTYFYSRYHGAPFLDAWAAQRAAALDAMPAGQDLHEEITPALELIRDVRARLKADRADSSAWRDMDRLLQRFEVTKRVHDAYRDTWRAVDPTRFRAANAYLELAEALAEAHELTGALTYLNALLKILDTLSSLSGDLSEGLRTRLGELVSREAGYVAEVRRSAAARTTPSPAPRPDIESPADTMPDTVLLACDSARSRAYIQAMCHFGMPPSHVFMMGLENDRPPDASSDQRLWNGLLLPDLAEPVAASCARAGIGVTRLPERDVNADATVEALAGMSADLVVYSGVGGQIVSERALTAGPRFLHMHSGWLPDYRGSTTIYYAILNGDLPGVTSILLDPGIDTGPVVLRQTYPMPEAGMDVDLVYDAAIRADLMCRTLARFSRAGSVDFQFVQSADEGRSYFVIHPVLKHIALLSLGKDRS